MMADSDSKRSSVKTPPPPKRQHPSQAFQWKLVPLPWRKATGAALTTAVALSVGLLSGHWVYGVWAFMGAFTSIYVAPEPYPTRGKILLAVGVGLALSLGLASWTAPSWWMTGLALGFIAATATFLTGAWHIPLPQSLLFILIAVIAAALPVDPGQTGLRMAFVLLGGFGGWLQGMSGWIFHRRKPETQAVKNAYRRIAEYFTAIGTDASFERQHQAALALKQAEDSVSALRRRWARDDPGYRLVCLADEAELLFRATVVLGASRPGRLPQAWGQTLTSLAEAVTGGRLGPIPSPPNDRSEWAKFRRQVQNVALAAESPLPQLRKAHAECPPSARRRITAAFNEASITTATYRMGIAVTVGAFLGHSLGEAHPYWIPLTIGAILQGSTARTMAWRSIQRLTGTILGLALALGVLLLHPGLAVILAAVVLLQFFMLLFIVRNYALAVALITTMALLIISSEVITPPWPMISARFIDTLIGAVIALAAIRLLWSKTSSEHLGSTLAQTIRLTGQVLSLSLEKARGEESLHTQRLLEKSVLHLQADYNRALNQIPTPSEVVHLWPAVVSAERLAYLVPAVVGTEGRRISPPLAEAVNDTVRRLFETLAHACETDLTAPAWNELSLPKIPSLHPIQRPVRGLIESLQAAALTPSSDRETPR